MRKEERKESRMTWEFLYRLAEKWECHSSAGSHEALTLCYTLPLSSILQCHWVVSLWSSVTDIILFDPQSNLCGVIYFIYWGNWACGRAERPEEMQHTEGSQSRLERLEHRKWNDLRRSEIQNRVESGRTEQEFWNLILRTWEAIGWF